MNAVASVLTSTSLVIRSILDFVSALQQPTFTPSSFSLTFSFPVNCESWEALRHARRTCVTWSYGLRRWRSHGRCTTTRATCRTASSPGAAAVPVTPATTAPSATSSTPRSTTSTRRRHYSRASCSTRRIATMTRASRWITTTKFRSSLQVRILHLIEFTPLLNLFYVSSLFSDITYPCFVLYFIVPFQVQKV